MRSAPVSTRVHYYHYDNAMKVSCNRCGWQRVAMSGQRETYRELFDVSCPKYQATMLIVGSIDIAFTGSVVRPRRGRIGFPVAS